jgi:hypothetical protein
MFSSYYKTLNITYTIKMVVMIVMVYKTISVKEETKKSFLKIQGYLMSRLGKNVSEDYTMTQILRCFELAEMKEV